MATRITNLPVQTLEGMSANDVLPITDVETNITRKVTAGVLTEYLIGNGAIGYSGSIGITGATGYTGSNIRGYVGSSGLGYTGSSIVGYSGSASTVIGYTGSAGSGGGGIVNNQLEYLELTATPPYTQSLLSTVVNFTRPNNSINTVDPIDTGLTIKRGNNGVIYNSAGNVETSANSSVSPLGTKWNADGWGDLSDVKTRTYTTFYNACDQSVGSNVVHKEFVMHDTINDKYYKIKFHFWQPNNGGGGGLPLDNRSGFSYTRTLIDTTVNYYFVRIATDTAGADTIDTGLTIMRGSAGGIYNSDAEDQWDPDVSPTGTLWNDDGWTDFTDLSTRLFTPLYSAVHGQLGNHLVGREMIMHDTINNKYYLVKFTEWGQNNGGSFAYYRRQIDQPGTNQGIIFADGSQQLTAYDPGNIKIGNNAISLRDTGLTIKTIADHGVSADLYLTTPANLTFETTGGEGEVYVANYFSITSGTSEFRDYGDYGSTVWNSATITVANFSGDFQTSLNLYLNSTYGIEFQTTDNKWYQTYSTNIATLNAGVYTIPISITNSNSPINIISIRLRDFLWNGSTTWTFDRQGHLRLPSLTIQDYNANNTYQQTLKMGWGGSNIAITNADYNLYSRGGSAIKIQGQRGFGTWSDSTYGGNGTDVYIWGGAGGESSTSDNGGEGGNVDIHGGIGQAGRDGGDIALTAGDARWTNGNNTVAGGHVWITAGTATSANGVAVDKGYGGDIRLYSGIGNTAGGDISFYTSDNGSSHNHTWLLKSDGSMVFPTLTVPISDNVNPSGTGQTLKFTDSSQQAIIYGPPADISNISAQRIILQGAPGQAGTSGEGGDIYLWAGSGGDVDGNGGDIKIRAGRGHLTGGGGYLNFQAGNAVNTGYGGYINIESGSSGTAGQGGDITVNANSGGYIRYQTYDPNFYGTTEWYMKKAGITRFPNNTIAGENTDLTIATKNIVVYNFVTAYFETGNGLVNGLSGQNANSFACTIRANQDGTYSLVSYTPGLNWNQNDTLTILGSDLGGSSPTNDLTLTIDTIGGSGEIIAITPSGVAVGKAWTFDTNGATTLPNSLDIIPISTYLPGAPFNGNIIRQTGSNLLQVVSIGAGGGAGIGWIENAPSGVSSGGIASISFNNTPNSTTINAGTFETDIQNWIFTADGKITLPNTSSIDAGVAGQGISLTTDRGTIRFGNSPEIGGTTHFHIMKDPGANVDLYFGDDFNYVLQRGPSSYGVEIGSNDNVGGGQQTWRFDTDGTTQIPGAITSAAGTGSVVINASDGVTRTWTLAGDGSTTFPNGAKLNNGTAYQFATDNGVVTSLDLRDAIGRGFYTSNDGYTLRSNSSYNWIFDTSGRTRFPTSTAPTHSYGAAGDTAGMVAFDSSYIYYCTANYVDNVTNIWKRVALDATPW